MDISLPDRTQALETPPVAPVADHMPRRPLWPALVIAFASLSNDAMDRCLGMVFYRG